MILTDYFNLGDKIDIQLTYQLEQSRKGELVEVKQYKSSVYEFASDTDIEITMPTDSGKLVLFQNGLRLHMLFYTRKGMFECYGVVKNRYKKENIMTLVVEIKTTPTKFQRREYFRIECSIDMLYYLIDENVAHLESTEALFSEIQNVEYIGGQRAGSIQDISGGGIRFVSNEEISKDSYILAVIRLTNSNYDNTFYLATKIISSEKIEHLQNKYSNRAKFNFKDIKDRESIVRYIFEEERRIRKKELGG